MSRNWRLFILLFPFTISFSFSQSRKDGETPEDGEKILETIVSSKPAVNTIEEVLENLHEVYGINFSYVNEFIPLHKKIICKAEKQPLRDLLNTIFKGLPIAFVALGNQVVLVKNELAMAISTDSTKANDSVSVFTLNKKGSLSEKKEGKRVQIADFFKPPFTFTFSLNNPKEQISDSLKVEQKEALDSIEDYKRKLRRMRIQYIKSQKYKRSFSFGIIFQPGFSVWKLKGNTNQSIDYNKYNDYGVPDFGFDARLFCNFRLYDNFYISPSMGFSNISRKGTHTNYLISYFNPNIAQPVTSNFSANYNFANLSLLAGYEIIYNKLKIALQAGMRSAFMVGRAAPDYLPFYEPKYYYLLGHPYLNNQNKTLEKEKIEYKKIYPFFEADFQFEYAITEKTGFLINISYKRILSNMYKTPASIIEKCTILGTGLGLKFNF